MEWGVYGRKTVSIEGASEAKGDRFSSRFTKLLTTSNPEGNPSLIVINSDNRTARGKNTDLSLIPNPFSMSTKSNF